MSAQDPNVDTGHGTPLAAEPEDEALPIGKILAVAVVSLVAFALGILWAVGILSGVESDNVRMFGPTVQPRAIGEPEIGMVDQTLFERERRAAKLAADKLAQLDGYGWVSRSQGIIHIPIGEAIKAVSQGRRPAGGGAVQPPMEPAPIPGVPESPQGTVPTNQNP